MIRVENLDDAFFDDEHLVAHLALRHETRDSILLCMMSMVQDSDFETLATRD
jgi:hypothetical protein